MTAAPFEIRTEADSAVDESGLIRKLALARAGLESATAAWNERLRWLQAHAGELFERRHRDRLLADIKAWRADPLPSVRLFGTTALSAGWLKHLWSGILMGLAAPVGLTFEQIRDLITSAGGDWRADRIDARCGGFMTLFLALSPDPEADLERWVAASLGLKRPGRRRSKPNSKPSAEIEDRFETLRRRARLFHQPNFGRDKAREALAKVATVEFRTWSEKADTMMKQYEDEKARSIAGPVPQDLGSAADIRETRRIQREMQRAERLVEKLERNLASLRRKLQAAARRQHARSTAKPARNRTPDSSVSNQRNPVSTDCETASPEIRQPEIVTRDVSNPDAIDTPAIENSNRLEIEPLASFEPIVPSRRPDPAKLAKSWRQRQSRGQAKREPAMSEHR